MNVKSWHGVIKSEEQETRWASELEGKHDCISLVPSQSLVRCGKVWLPALLSKAPIIPL
jgi:hypothetical protein